MANTTADVAEYSSVILNRVYEASAVASLVPVHDHYLPFPPLTLLHALVVSHNALLITGYYTHNKGNVNLAATVFLNQMLLLGPLSVLCAMLAQPSPVLLAPDVICIYAGVHILNVISGLGNVLVRSSQTSGVGFVIDTVAAFVDSFARMDGIAVLGVEVVRNHPNVILANSPFAALFVGTCIGIGSILMLGAITFEQVDWHIRKPTWLVTPSALLAADFISSFTAALAYFVLTSSRGLEALINPTRLAPVLHTMQPYILPVMPYAAAVSGSALNILQISSRQKGTTSSHAINRTLLSPAEARALGACIIFAFAFGARLKRAVLMTISSTGPSPSVASNLREKAMTNGTSSTSSLSNADDTATTSVVKASARKSSSAKKRK